jgi:hypothetical protein
MRTLRRWLAMRWAEVRHRVAVRFARAEGAVIADGTQLENARAAALHLEALSHRSGHLTRARRAGKCLRSASQGITDAINRAIAA